MAMLDRLPAYLTVVVSVCVMTASIAGAQDQGTLRVRVLEGGRPLPVRAWVDVESRRYFMPSEPATCTPYPRDRSFSCDGAFTMTLPVGKAVIHVERGKEYRPLDHS